MTVGELVRELRKLPENADVKMWFPVIENYADVSLKYSLDAESNTLNIAFHLKM